MSRHFDPCRALVCVSGICLLIGSPFALAACGGDDSNATQTAAGASGPTLSKAQVISRAEAICKKGDGELNRTAQQAFSGKSATAAERARYATQTGIPIVERMVARLRSLSPPDDQRFGSILTAADQEIAAVKKQPGDFGDNAFVRTDTLAHAYGLPDC